MHDDFELGLGAHDHNLTPIDLEDAEDIEGLEMFTLRSVGIDIGSSTTHLIFSKLVLRREGAGLSAKFRVTERKLLYRSPIMLTPYVAGTQIDFEKVKLFFHDAYHEAGFTSDDIDTGAVVTTGEALKKENAKPITEFFASHSGKFICASAGPNHEALLAAYGCGAVAMSKDEHATVLNLDCGGGTAKLSVIRDGLVTQTGAIECGARLLAFDENGLLSRVERPAIRIMRELGYPEPRVGGTVTEEQRQKFSHQMVDCLYEVIQGGALSTLTQDLLLTDPITDHGDASKVDFVVCSGGVSEYIYDHDRAAYGDVGPIYGRALRQRLDGFRKDWVREPTEGIRATVIGAGEYTTQASGTTSFISNREVLPAFGLQVVRPAMDGGLSIEDSIMRGLSKVDKPRYTSDLAIALSIIGQQDYQSLRRLAEGIDGVLKHSDGTDDPLFVILDMDIAKSLGGILKEELGVSREIIAVDSIDVGDLDYVDIGKPLGVSEAIPVTVKSLMFPSEAGR